MKRILSLILSVIMILASLTLVASAEEAKYAPEVGDGYIKHDYNNVCGGMVLKDIATVERNVEWQGKKAVKVTPTPRTDGAASASAYTLDCYVLKNFDAKVEVPKYKYVAVEYYYATDNPTYTGNLYFSLSSGGTNALTSSINTLSNTPIETNKWATAYFNFSSMKINESSETPWLNQVHFRPFNTTQPKMLRETDVIYVASYTFYEKNPDPNLRVNVYFDKGDPGIAGAIDALTIKPGETYTLPDASAYTVSDGAKAEFLGWKEKSSGTLYPAGQQFTAEETNKTFVAQWNLDSAQEFVSIDFTKYQGGIASHRDTGVVENTTYDNRDVVKITANPASTSSKVLTVDGFNYQGAGVDLRVFKWFAVEYKYVSDNPKNATISLDVLKNGGALKSGTGEVFADAPLVEGQWAIALFDFSKLGELIDPNASSYLMKQMYVRPYGSKVQVPDLNAKDEFYISRLMFFREKPDFENHASYMTGYNDATFKPNKTMTRAEACTVVARLLDTEENIAKNTTTAFTDVAADKWYAKYISFCEAKGLLNSYSGTFLPEQAITRAEFAELVYNMGLVKEDPANTKTFSDVTSAHPKYDAIMAAASAGLIGGYADGTFLPDRPVTRAQVVTIVNRAKGTSKKADAISADLYTLFLDVDATHWAFAEIAEATVAHVEKDGAWVYYTQDPVTSIAEKVGKDKLYNVEAGNKKVAELDELEAKRIEEIRNTPSMDLSHIKGAKYYVSNKGSDSNDGLSEATPFATIKKAISVAKSGDAILLERGGLWREQNTVHAGLTITAYGEDDNGVIAAKPMVYASPENGADPEKWSLVYSDEKTGAKIWKYANTKMVDVGNIVFNEGDEANGGGFAYKKTPPCFGDRFIVKVGASEAYDYKTGLDKNFTFFHAANSTVSGGRINVATAVGPLYLRCDNGNPGYLFDSIEFAIRGNIFSVRSDVTIDNVCLKYGGSHGIGMGTVKNVKYTNLEIGWIGGSFQNYNNDGSITRFGNGIEVYGGCDGYIVDNCYIYQNYDAGVTHQYSMHDSGDCREDNVTYSNNVITDTVYSIEYFLTEEDGLVRAGKNILIEGNLLRRAGFGFGSTRENGQGQGHLRSGGQSNPFENFVVRNNVFDRSVNRLIIANTSHAAYAPKMEGNIYIQGIGNHVYDFGHPRVLSDADLSIQGKIKSVLGDETGTFYFVDTIPAYEFNYSIDKVDPNKYEVVEDKAEVYVPEIDPAETISEPYLIKYAGDKGFYGSVRDSMKIELKEENGAKYLNIKPVKAPKQFLLDVTGINPALPIDSGKICIKMLVRTNYKARPYVNCYTLKGQDGAAISGGIGIHAQNELTANDKWEEVYITKADIDPKYATCGQLHLQFWNTGITGEQFFTAEGAERFAGAYIDIAAWAVFPNQSSAVSHKFEGFNVG